MHLQILLAAAAAAMAFLGSATAQDSCETSCGNVTYAFPFGSEEGCYLDPGFQVTCDRSSGEPIPFFGNSTTNIVITNMSTSESEMEIMMYVAHDCYNTSGPVDNTVPSLSLTYFRISTKNRFVAIGCDTYAYISGDRGGEYQDGTGCTSICGSNTSSITDESCSGVGCCQVAIPQGMSSFEITLSSYRNHTDLLELNPCSYGFVVAPGKFNFSTNNLHRFGSKMPMLLEWAIGNETCDQIASKDDVDKLLCKENSECDKDYGGPGYRCRCKPGYDGNPYIQHSCKNINECERKDPSVCQHECVDLDGDYECRCPKGYSGGDKKDGRGCIADESLVLHIVV
ncbi:EGF-like calcium-binding, partial [Cynara cardunculus var. scolymus]